LGVKKFILGLFVVIGLALPALAAADSCANVSRAPAACGYACPGPVIDGNWAWLPSLDPSNPPIWGFAPPGAADSVAFGLPGANGNYTNGQASSLLGMSAICQGGGNVNDVRQSSHGIQSGCQ
jgi:hypothetical protein